MVIHLYVGSIQRGRTADLCHYCQSQVISMAVNTLADVFNLEKWVLMGMTDIIYLL